MKRAIAGLILAAVLPGCGCFDRLMGKEKPMTKTFEPAPVKPIAAEQLAQLLPKLDGWQNQPPVGRLVDIGKDKASRATAKYERTIETMTSTATLDIIDGAYSADITGPLMRMAHSQGEHDPHKIAVEIEGFHGVQEWKPDAGKVEVAVLVARRFLITLDGHNITPQDVDRFLKGIDVKKLASWAGTPTDPPRAQQHPGAP